MSEVMIRQAFRQGKNSRQIATMLGVSQRTLLRRAREFNIPLNRPGRPRKDLVVTMIEPGEEKVRQQERDYWFGLSLEERINAVEVLSAASTFAGNSSQVQKLERFYQPFDQASRSVSRRRGARTRHLR